jgi:hypothetical protein
MKKVSTVVAKQRRNVSQPTLIIGLDLGDRNSWYCVLLFGAMPRSRIALEIGTHSPGVTASPVGQPRRNERLHNSPRITVATAA